MRLTRVVFPAPVLPMIAVVLPDSAKKVTSLRTGCSAPGYEKLTSRNSTVPWDSSCVTGSSAARTDDGVFSTSPIRSAHTAARGTRTAMKVAIITAIRICIRYWRNAVRVPICREPSCTRKLPNQITATLETFSTSITIGNISAKRRPAFSAVSVTSSLAAVKRSVSTSSRTKARTTRMPVSCSRSTRLTRSIRTCILRKSGIIRLMMIPTATSRMGTLTAISHDSWMS